MDTQRPPVRRAYLVNDMKILVIATGGTIGSAFDGETINIQSEDKCPVAGRYAAEHSDAAFDIINPVNILSEHLSADDLNALAKAVYTRDTSAYDGVIFTSGSDNLGYIAAFISLIMCDTDLPVCIVAANMLMSDSRSNGYLNFCTAVELIRSGIKGVTVPYRNDDGVMYVHSAADIRQADMTEDFCSFNGFCGVYDGSFKELRPYISHKIPAVFSADRLPEIRDNVMLIHPYPMLDYSRLKTEGVRAVAHTLYHSATLDSARALDFLYSIGNVPFYLASLRSDRKIYQSTADILKAGAVPLYDISPECAYMKLLLACAQDELSITGFMEFGK